MGASILGVYNAALRWLESRPLANLQEPREPRRLLDAEWTNAVNKCLYDGYWNFAIRMVQANPDVNQQTIFSYKYCYTKPADWIRTFQVSEDDRFYRLIRKYEDHNNVWFCDIPTMYVKYVSSDTNFGWNLGLWTPGFTEYLAGYLATLIGPRVIQDGQKIQGLDMRLKRTKASALATDAMDLPPGRPPLGTWVEARAPRGSIYPAPGWLGD